MNWCLAQRQQNTQAQKPPVEKKAFVDSIQRLRNTLTKVQLKLDSMANANQNLKYAHESLTKHVDDTRLRETLRAAESTINTQNSWMTGFGTIYAIITVVFGVITIIISVQSRDAINKADEATNRLIERTDYFNDTINNEITEKLDAYDAKVEKSYMNSLFRKLTSNLPQTRTLGYEELSALERRRLSDEHIIKLFDLLNMQQSKKERAIVVEILIEMHDAQNSQ